VTPSDLARALEAHALRTIPALPGRTNHLHAGVLVPLVWDPEPVVLLTLRAGHLGRHAGEVAFPGGKPEPGDADLEATARREAAEELGLTEATVLGRLSSMPLYTSDFRLEPFVAEVPPGDLIPDPGEVARVLRVPLAEQLAAQSIEGVPYVLDGRQLLSPVFTIGGETMFGATAHTFLELLEVVSAAWGKKLPPVVAGALSWTDLLGPRERKPRER
jgi:8-oxo-dGTP pyrophosphatase MutT (NUDIX family)